ncbi:MAG: radical SAM protein [Sandaracinaceae bacterium]|nr:radical SAM protein [Sandaracinaceae bacterium]
MTSLPVLSSHAPSEADTSANADGFTELHDTPWIGPNGKRTEWLELHLTYTCPERCVFCSEEHRMQRYKKFPVTWGRVATVLRQNAERGVKRVHLTGGEPTIHPDFVRTLQLAKKLGMRTSVGTIGTMLARPDFADRAVPFLDEALFSMHGPDAETHDAMTRREGSFVQVTGALAQAQRVNPDFNGYINSVITRANVERLPDTVRKARELGAKLLVVSNLTPEGLGFDDYERLTVRLEQLAEILPTIPEVAGDMTIRFFGVPMCLLGPHRMLSNDLHWDPRVTVEWGDLPGKVAFQGFYNWTPDRKRVRAAECQGCAWNTVCMGVYDRYAEVFPTTALRPERVA